MNWDAGTIRRARETRGWSQRRLAEQLGASLRTVTAWELGEAKPSGRMTGALDRELGDATTTPGKPPLDEASDAELLAEIATRLARARDQTAGDQTVGRDVYWSTSDAPTAARRRRQPPKDPNARKA